MVSVIYAACLLGEGHSGPLGRKDGAHLFPLKPDSWLPTTTGLLLSPAPANHSSAPKVKATLGRIY